MYVIKSKVCVGLRKCPMAANVSQILADSPWYRRNNGRDHLFLVGMNYFMDFHILKPACKAFLVGVCNECTKLAIDDYSFMYTNKSEIDRGINWHAVPFPSDFHWSRVVQRPFPWESNQPRDILVSYVGSAWSTWNPAVRYAALLVIMPYLLH